MNEPENILDLLRERARIRGEIYARAAEEPAGTESADTVAILKIAWLESRIDLARELRK
jgi:hypothetical protein